MTDQEPTSTEELEVLEAHLAGTLKRVAPPKRFVKRLRENLRARIRIPQRAEIANRLGDWRKMFIVFGSVMSGFLILVTIVRALFYLSGRRNG